MRVPSQVDVERRDNTGAMLYGYKRKEFGVAIDSAPHGISCMLVMTPGKFGHFKCEAELTLYGRFKVEGKGYISGCRCRESEIFEIRDWLIFDAHEAFNDGARVVSLTSDLINASIL